MGPGTGGATGKYPGPGGADGMSREVVEQQRMLEMQREEIGRLREAVAHYEHFVQERPRSTDKLPPMQPMQNNLAMAPPRQQFQQPPPQQQEQQLDQGALGGGGDQGVPE